MRKIWCCLAVVAMTLSMPAWAGIQVGAASVTVNPEMGVHLGGYGHGRKATGIHDPLYAKAAVFSDGQSALALVVVDAVSLQRPTIEKIRAAGAGAAGDLQLPPERIIVQATHTHAAPDTIGIYGPSPSECGRDEAYMAALVKGAGAAVRAAARRLAPAELVHAETEGGEWAVNDSEPGKLDRSVTVLQARDSEGKSIVTLTNFACHPTVLDGENTLVSSDWVAAYYVVMNKAQPGEHLFLQGCIGAWIQPKTPERSFALAEQYGSDLARRALAALENPTTLEPGLIRFDRKVFGMSQDNPRFTAMTEMGLVERQLGETVETEVAWFAIGDAQFATHPAESSPEHGLETKKMMRTGPKFVLGLAMDHLGYFCPLSFYEQTESIPHAPYLVSMSPGPKSGAELLEALREIIP